MMEFNKVLLLLDVVGINDFVRYYMCNLPNMFIILKHYLCAFTVYLYFIALILRFFIQKYFNYHCLN